MSAILRRCPKSVSTTDGQFHVPPMEGRPPIIRTDSGSCPKFPAGSFNSQVFALRGRPSRGDRREAWLGHAVSWSSRTIACNSYQQPL